MLNKGMAASHVERDAAIRDLRASLARLLRWIRKCTPHWGRDMAFGVVRAAVKRLEQAVTSNAFLSAPTKVLERLHPPAAVGPPRQVWNQDARQQLKTLPLDDGHDRGSALGSRPSEPPSWGTIGAGSCEEPSPIRQFGHPTAWASRPRRYWARRLT